MLPQGRGSPSVYPVNPNGCTAPDTAASAQRRLLLATWGPVIVLDAVQVTGPSATVFLRRRPGRRLLLPLRREQATDRGRMPPASPCRVRLGLPPRVHHVDKGGLLLRSQRGPAPPDPTARPGRREARVRARIMAHSNSAKPHSIAFSGNALSPSRLS
jgi:hypothetical protein